MSAKPASGGKNFGWGSRSMEKSISFALSDAVREGVISGDTRDRYEASMARFSDFLADEGIKDLNKVTVDNVSDFARACAARCELEKSEGGITEKTAINIISNVNSTLAYMSGRDDLKVPPSDYAERPERAPQTERVNSEDAREGAYERWGSLGEFGERLEALGDIQAMFGARFEESAKLNAAQALEELRERGGITLEVGTKGGQARFISVFEQDRVKAEFVLEKAAIIQEQHFSMIPEKMTENTFTNIAYNSVRGTSYTFHANRHEFANDRYEKLLGHASPLRYEGEKSFIQSLADTHGISRDEAIALDKDVRLEISESLGHHRVSISACYIGAANYDE